MAVVGWAVLVISWLVVTMADPTPRISRPRSERPTTENLPERP
jgi:hypothetical protein